MVTVLTTATAEMCWDSV